MGIDFGVIWAADFDNTIKFYLRRPARRPTVTRRPPSHKSLKDMTSATRPPAKGHPPSHKYDKEKDISLSVSIFGLI